jgi:hypothetical protein
MTAASLLIDPPLPPAMADALLLYLDVARGSDEAIFKSRELVAGLTMEQALRLRLIVHSLGDTPNRWVH